MERERLPETIEGNLEGGLDGGGKPDRKLAPAIAISGLFEVFRDPTLVVPHLDRASLASGEGLLALVGRRVLFHDPCNSQRFDDPSYKEGVVIRDQDRVGIEVDRAMYYPYYTGFRPGIFWIDAPADWHGLDVTLL